MWRRWRRLPAPLDGWGEARREAVLTAFAVQAALHERTLGDIAQAFSKRKDDGGK
jgi:hypothetical protein